MQHGLVSLGYEIGRVDGVLGARSQAAISSYQSEKGLAVTGRLTGEVSEALQALGRRHVEEVRAERERRERERLERERLAREEAERERLAREEAERKRLAQEETERERVERERTVHEPARRFRDCEGTWCPEMVVVPAGTYTGTSSEEGHDEGSRHEITIANPFAVGVFEVTRGEWRRFVKQTGYAPPRNRTYPCYTGTFVPIRSSHNFEAYLVDKGILEARKGTWRSPGYRQTDMHPVVCVNGEDAQAYVRWLSEVTDKKYRLLSPSEWEYAARRGTNPARYWDADDTEICNHANGADRALKMESGFEALKRRFTKREWDFFKKRYAGLRWETLTSEYHEWESSLASCDDGHARTSPVGSYSANGFGLHDVLGNVSEWVEVCDDSGQGAPNDGSTRYGEESCYVDEKRGGSWAVEPSALSWYYNTHIGPFRSNHTGFRVARTLD